ncbi:MAG: gliding motility-associated C-terminal domain-containing protein, partial [Bacteroidia bacterium]|nr:gliding motility-associated C-terminal domain-containing protein [Bacteroidia bacterium]
MFKKTSIFFLFLLFATNICRATHNRAGEITYRWIAGTTYEITVTTYTSTAPGVTADRCELTIYFGDGDSCVAARTNGPKTGTSCDPAGMGVQLSSIIKVNTYVCQHTYKGPGKFILHMEDPNRNGGVYNIPNSVNVVFYIQTELIINPFLGTGINNSPVLLNAPIDNGCTGKCFYHNPGAYDPDGDSLSFKLVTCLGMSGTPILGYRLPNIAPNGVATGSLTLNPYTGDLAWCSPVDQGEYNIAILIEEWRNGYLIGNVERDMQITIGPCSNNPPDFFPLHDTCVEAGSTVTFPVTAYDVDRNNVTLSAVGGPLSPFVATPAATFSTAVGGDTITSIF